MPPWLARPAELPGPGRPSRRRAQVCPRPVTRWVEDAIATIVARGTIATGGIFGEELRDILSADQMSELRVLTTILLTDNPDSPGGRAFALAALA